MLGHKKEKDSKSFSTGGFPMYNLVEIV